MRGGLRTCAFAAALISKTEASTRKHIDLYTRRGSGRVLENIGRVHCAQEIREKPEPVVGELFGMAIRATRKRLAIHHRSATRHNRPLRVTILARHGLMRAFQREIRLLVMVER